MNILFPLSSAFLALWSLASPAPAQWPASTPPVPPSRAANQAQSPYQLKATVQKVVLDVVVTDAKGNLVTDLTKDDFQVFEDKVPQMIQTMDRPPANVLPKDVSIDSTAELDRKAPNAPVTLIVLDEINTRFRDEALARHSLKESLNQQGDKLQQPTLLGAVDMQRFTLLHDYTTSKQEILDALDHHFAIYPWHMEGTSFKIEQFNASFAALLEIAKATGGHPGHKSLLWVGNGFPAFDPTTLAATQATDLKMVVEACTNAMRDARIALYTLDPAGVSMEPPTEDLDGFENDPFSAMLDFNMLAQATGGHAFYGHNDVDKLIAISARDGASFYTLSYKPAVPVTDMRTFRRIRVVMKNTALTAKTREGYYVYPPPPEVTPGASKHANRAVFDLNLAAQSVLVYDAVHMTVESVAQKPDTFKITLNSSDLVWQPGHTGKLTGKITVALQTFDRKGTMANRSLKISTLQVDEGSPNTAATRTVFLYATVPTNASATRVRVVVRVDANQKIGALNFPLNGPTPASGIAH